MYDVRTQAFIKLADVFDEDLIGSLSAIYKSKLDGKELQIDVDSMMPAHTGSQEASVQPQSDAVSFTC